LLFSPVFIFGRLKGYFGTSCALAANLHHSIAHFLGLSLGLCHVRCACMAGHKVLNKSSRFCLREMVRGSAWLSLLSRVFIICTLESNMTSSCNLWVNSWSDIQFAILTQFSYLVILKGASWLLHISSKSSSQHHSSSHQTALVLIGKTWIYPSILEIAIGDYGHPDSELQFLSCDFGISIQLFYVYFLATIVQISVWEENYSSVRIWSSLYTFLCILPLYCDAYYVGLSIWDLPSCCLGCEAHS